MSKVFTRPSLFFFLMIISLLQVHAQSSHVIKLGEVKTIGSKILGEEREFYVQLPDSYDADSTRHYPVVFLLDGDSLFDALCTVHNYYWGGFMPEMVLIGISNAQNRTRDLTTSVPTSGQGMMPGQRYGEAEKFLSFIEEELIPQVTDNYRVTPYRTLIGHSHGGLFTINALLKDNGLFTNYLAIDPSLDWDDQKLLKEAQANQGALNLSKKSLHISLGSPLHMQDKSVTIDNVMEDESPLTLRARSNIGFARLAERIAHASDFKTHWKYYERDLHGSIPLPSIMDGLISLFEWFQMEDTDVVNNLETSAADLEAWMNRRASKLADHFGYEVPPAPEDLLFHLGQMMRDMGQQEKSLLYFKLHARYYPQRVHAHVLLSGAHEAAENYEEALKSAEKAFALSGSPEHKQKVEALKKKAR